MVVIIGGGLAGLSTAYHLGDAPHTVLESEETAGGLCRTREVKGFLFDYTGHLLHLRDERIVRLVDELVPGAFRKVERDARIRTHGVTLPFPFQANLHGVNLRGANLSGVNLGGADLSGANLEDVNVTDEQLATATLKGATLPDGTRHD